MKNALFKRKKMIYPKMIVSNTPISEISLFHKRYANNNNSKISTIVKNIKTTDDTISAVSSPSKYLLISYVLQYRPAVIENPFGSLFT